MHKEFHSTPELCWEQQNGEPAASSWTPRSEHEPVHATSSVEDWRKSTSQEDVFAVKGQQRSTSRRSWVSNKKTSGARGARYHGSWQNIDGTYHQPEDEDDDTEEELGDEDGDDVATPVVDQLSLPGNGEYRTPKPVRPVYSTGSSSTLPRRAVSPHCTAPPPDHPPPPPPPPSQVIKVDVGKPYSEYAVAAAAATSLPSPGDRPTTPVMSSFRPSDNAKLYATPEEAKAVGYMTLRPTKKPSTSPTSSPASRSMSLPPRSVRPNVLVKSSPPKAEEPRVSVTVNSAPLIPEPDYDSEDDTKSCNSIKAAPPRPQQTPNKLLIEIKQTGQQQKREPSGGMSKSQSFCADILRAKSQLKTSQSYPEDLVDGHHDAEDAYVTFVPVNGGKESAEEAKDRNGTLGRRQGNLTRHAVSLIQLPPPVENGEMDADEAKCSLGECAIEQDSVSTVSTLSSLSTSSNSSDRDATVLENKPYRKMNGHWGNPSEDNQAMADGERTIEESLQLIRKHVDELSGMDSRRASNGKRVAPMVPPPPLFEGQQDEDAFLAPPPPEFSDTDVTHKAANFQRPLPKSMSSGQLRGALGDGTDETVPVSAAAHFLNRRVVERRLSDDAMSKPTVRVVGTVPKKVSFSPDVLEAETSRTVHHQMVSSTRSFPHKPLHEWSVNDTADWLDSLFLSEYKAAFVKKNVDGAYLMRMNNESLVSLGVKLLGHRLNIEKSLRHYARGPRT